MELDWHGVTVSAIYIRFITCSELSEAKREACPPTEAGTTTNTVTSSNIDRDRKDDKEKIPPKRSRKTRKQKESLQYHLCHHDQALRGVSWGNIEEIIGSTLFYHTVKLLLAADRTDGSRWAAVVD
jgi:hypothetical protein